jgi:hypothetical protein
MPKISNPILSLFATALLLGLNLSLQSARANETDSTPANGTDSVHADNCLAAPATSTPKGQHWYYRTERQNGRKCWYLHAGAPLAHHAAARPHSKAATSAISTAATHKKPAASDEAVPPPPTNTQDSALEVAAPPPSAIYPQPAPEAASAAATWPGAAAEAAPSPTAVPFLVAPPATATDAVQPQPPAAAVQPQPHIEILRTEPVGEAARPSAPTPPAAQGGSTAVDKATSTDGANTVQSNTRSEAKDAAVAEPRPDAEHDESDTAQQEPAETPSLVGAITTLQPTELFFLLAIGLSAVVFLVAIASRIVAKRREPIITEYPNSAWNNDRFDPPRLEAPQFADEAMDEQWTDEEHDVPFIDPQALDDPHEQDRVEQPALTHKSATALSVPSPPDPKSLEPVLRILRHS